jgi:MFS family permease
MRSRFERLIVLAAILLVGFGLSIVTSSAQPVIIDTALAERSPLVAFLVEMAIVIFGPIIGSLIALVLARAYVWLGLKQTAENRATIEQVLDRAVDFIRVRYGSPALGVIPDALRQEALRAGAEYALRNGPKALAAEGIKNAGSTRLEAMIEGRLADFLTPFQVASGTLSPQ